MGQKGSTWFDQLDDEQDNLRAVLRWAGGAGRRPPATRRPARAAACESGWRPCSRWSPS